MHVGTGYEVLVYAIGVAEYGLIDKDDLNLMNVLLGFFAGFVDCIEYLKARDFGKS